MVTPKLIPTIADLAERLRVVPEFTDFVDYQLECFDHWSVTAYTRLCLYYRTGAGKSITSLCCVALRGDEQAVVVAPPITHPAWVELGKVLGVEVTAVSHAKFRMKTFKVSRYVALIVDEFHLLGGHKGQGWGKLDMIARGMVAPLLICSATPNYNDAERVYCIQHVMDPVGTGKYLDFIYRECDTEQNPFGIEPIVKGFRRFNTAEAYLDSLPYVVHVPDLHDPQVVDIEVKTSVPAEFEDFGLNRRKGRINASQMEERHQRKYINLVEDDGFFVRPHIYDELTQLVGAATGPVLMFCASSQVATALFRSCKHHQVNCEVLTGHTSTKVKNAIVEEFKTGSIEVLIGTATLGTGTDGFDKVCDMLILVDDTDDDAFRKQLMGRILPRGLDTDASNKQFYRLVF